MEPALSTITAVVTSVITGVITPDLQLQPSTPRPLLCGFWVSWVCLLDGASGSDRTKPSHCTQ